LKACGRLTDELLVDLIQKCEDLEEIELDGVYGLTDVSLGYLFKLNLLKKLCLGWATQCFGHQFGASGISPDISLMTLQLVSCHLFDDQAAKLLSSGTKSLKCLLIEDAPLFGDVGLSHLLKSSRSSITSLTLDGCPRITDVGLLDSLGLVDNIQLHLQNLCFVSLPAVSDTSLVAISKSSPQLKSLVLTACHLTNDAIKSTLQWCSQLHQLELNGIPHLQGKRVVNYIRNLRAIKHLDISWCKDLEYVFLGYFDFSMADFFI